MEQIKPFNPQKLEAACKILAHTEHGLKGSEISYILAECKVADVSPPNMTKWKRLFNASGKQKIMQPKQYFKITPV